MNIVYERCECMMIKVIKLHDAQSDQNDLNDHGVPNDPNRANHHPPPITKGTPHLHPKKLHNFRLRTIQNSCISIVDLMPPIPLPPPPNALP